MKILAIHADFIEFAAKKKAYPKAEEANKDKHKIEECLVIFTAVEKSDEADKDTLLKLYLKEIKDLANQVNATNVVLYPYAHLSSNLSKPEFGQQVMQEAEIELKKDKSYSVSRAPFGWYKSFNISCKGHPLSELSREIHPEQSQLKRNSKDTPFSLHQESLSVEQKVKLTAAYACAIAAKQMFPKAQIGPAGFYHEQAYIDLANIKLKPSEFKGLQKKVKGMLRKGFKIEKTKNKPQDLQLEIHNDSKAPTFNFNDSIITPLFKDPFSKPEEIQAFSIYNVGSVYWKSNENNEQLTRVYLNAFKTTQELQDYDEKLKAAQDRSHIKIGKDQGLFVISPLVGKGLPLLAPKGMIIREEIVGYLWELHKNQGYQRVWTPHIAKQELYKTSGHWDKFGDELFKVQGKDEQFIMKPMNCPHHMQVFNAFSYSYKDLPVRYFEPATIYRDEKSGQLLGLSRVRAITQDDGHLFCRADQITDEAKKIVEIIHKFYNTLGMDQDYWVSLSVRDDDESKWLGTDENWHMAEKALEMAAKEMKLPYKRIEGEAAFYGPKLDFMFKDALGREWQLGTVQCDFNLPERFDLTYANEEGKKERPVVIHRAISGSLERFMSVLIEHFAGKFPLWLSAVQVSIATINDTHSDFAHAVAQKMREFDLRVQVDDRVESMGKKVRDAQQSGINYILTIGDQEIKNNTVSVRSQLGNVEHNIPVDEFIGRVVEQRDQRKL